MSFNNYRIRQAAHNLSRENSGWNPFRHTYRSGGGQKLHQTWDVRTQPDTERTAGHGNDDDGGGGSPIVHSQTAPERFPSKYERDETLVPGSSKETRMHDMEPTSQPDSGETFAQSHRSTTGGSAFDARDLLRRRGPSDGSRLSPGAPAHAYVAEEKPKKGRTFFKHLTPKEPFTVANQIRRTLLNSWINLLLIAAPVGIALNFVKSVPQVCVFVINFIAIVPLAAMLSFATEEIALRTGETLGGLLNATFGNAVELIIAIIALVHNEVVIVQTSLIGSILSNLLLVMGMCFFCGGLNRQEQFFNTTVAQTAASLLALAVAGVIIPTVFEHARDVKPLESDVAALSRGTSVILLIVYGAYLFFQLHTHSKVFAEESQKVEGKPFKRSFKHKDSLKNGAIAQGFVSPAGVMNSHGLPSHQQDTEKLRELLTTPPKKLEEDEEGEEPQLHFLVAIATLTLSTVIIAVCAEFMVDSIGAITGAISPEFVGLILLPIVGNAAEHATAVTVAIKDKMDLAIGVAVGSSMQVALFIIPLLVIIGWGMGNDNMNLSFDTYQVTVLFVAVLLVNYLIADGKSHWLEGMLLICLYAIIAVCSFWYKPDEEVPVA